LKLQLILLDDLFYRGTGSKGIKYDLLFIYNLIQLYCDKYEK